MLLRKIFLSYLLCFNLGNISSFATQEKYLFEQLPSEQVRWIDHTINIGIVIEQSTKGTIAPETTHYFINLHKFIKIDKKVLHIRPVPLNAFISERISLDNLSNKEKITRVHHLVQRDLKNISGVVIPGDSFNFPAFRLNADPIDELLAYNGTKELHDEQTIYGMSAREFYEIFPDHLLNPYSDSLIYEAILIKTLNEKKFPMLTSCHGTQMMGFLHRANFKSGIKDHMHHNVSCTAIVKRTLAAGLLGKNDCITRHFHKIALVKSGFPKSLVISGWEKDFVEVLENPDNANYLGFQGHPELSPDHPALWFLIENAATWALKNS